MEGFIKIIFLMPLILIGENTYAQKQSGATPLTGQARIDSLVKELNSGRYRSDTNKVNLLCQISFEYPYINPAEGIKYGMQALELANKLSWDKGIADANSAIGGDFENKTDHANALMYEYAALKIYEKTGEKNKMAIELGNIGIIYHHYNDQAKALEYDSTALNMYDELADSSGKAMMLANIANIYSDQGQKNKALEYQFRALKINEMIGNKQKIAMNLGNIGNAYADLGNFSEAMDYYFKGLDMDQNLNDQSAMARDMGNIGETYLEMAKDLKEQAGKAANLQKAIGFLKKSVEKSIEINRPGFIIEYSQSLSEAYNIAGDFNNALNSFKLYITVRDSMGTLEKDKEFARNKLQYEYGKREDQILYQKKLDSQKYIAGSAVLLLLSFFLFYNYRVQKKSNVVITKEKKRSDDLLLNILPAEVAEELKNKGKTDAKFFDNVTVLFTDFVGFTKVAERLTPQQLVNELDTCFKAFDGIIGKYNVEKIKTVGDAYLAVAGLPASDPIHAEQVVNAARDIRGFMLERKKTAGQMTFEIRIGVHSGSVVAGIVGVKKFAYDIWGDTVNTAARMEQNSEAGKVNISQTTYELVKNKFTCTYRGEIVAKNKGEMKMYFVA